GRYGGDRFVDRDDEVLDLVVALYEEHHQVEHQLHRLDDGRGRVGERQQPDDAFLDHGGDEPVADGSHHRLFEVGELVLDFLPQRRWPFGEDPLDQRVALLDHVEHLGGGRNLLDHPRLDVLVGQPEDLQDDRQDALRGELERTGQVDLGERPRQPADDALDQVRLDVLEEVFDAVADRAEQVLDERDGILEDRHDGLAGAVEELEHRLGVDPGDLAGTFDGRPQRFCEVALHHGAHDAHGRLQRRLEGRQDLVERLGQSVGKRGDAFDGLVGHVVDAIDRRIGYRIDAVIDALGEPGERVAQVLVDL